MADYIVKSGDTLSKIAAEFGTTVAQLAQSNGITNPNLIFAGQKIEVGENKSNYDTYSAKTTETGSTGQASSKAKGNDSLKSQVADIDFSKFSHKDAQKFLEEAQWLSEEEIKKRYADIEKQNVLREKEYEKLLNLRASNGIKYGNAQNTIKELFRKYKNSTEKTGDFTFSLDLRPWQDRMTPEDKAKYEAASKAIEEIENVDSRISKAYSQYEMEQEFKDMHFKPEQEEKANNDNSIPKSQTSEQNNSQHAETEHKDTKNQIGKFFKGWAKAGFGFATGNGFLGISGLKDMFS